MILTYFDATGVEHLIEEYFQLVFDNLSVPFKSIIPPLGQASLSYNFDHRHKAIIGNSEIVLEGIMLTGQFNKPYEWLVTEKGRSFGMSFHPTALYKLFNIDISRFENTHLPLKNVDNSFSEFLNSVLDDYKNPESVIEKINSYLNDRELTINKHTDIIDGIIASIREKEGLLSIDEILSSITISQKTLETQFKKIVGVTPAKYVRLYRFLRLMRKYEEKKISLQDLIHMYNYYDRSHFSKDFKLFMNKTMKSHFSEEYPLVKELLKK